MLHKNKEYYAKSEWTVSQAKNEIESGLKLLDKINRPIVGFFGSKRLQAGNRYYNHCMETAFQLGKKGYAIMTGGGPGIMKAANAGATSANAPSIGLQAKLLTAEKITDNIFTHKVEFHFFFVRRFIMSIKSDALIFYPGRYGTINELFEYAMLMHNDIVDRVPLICVDKKYWQGLFNWMEDNPAKEDFPFFNTDKNLVTYADSVRDVLNTVKRGKKEKKDAKTA